MSPMSRAAGARDQFLPQPPGGLRRGAALALLAHAAMLAALTLVVQWRSSQPQVVSAELWSALPQAAAPPAPPPAPEPRPAPSPSPAPPAPPPPRPAVQQPEAQIAIEQARKRQAEDAQRLQREQREKAERERAEKERAEKAAKEESARRQRAEREREEKRERERLQAEEKRLAEARKQQLERMMGQVGGSGSTQGAAAAVSSGPSASYAGRLIAAIKPNVVFTDTVSGNPAAEVEVRAGPSGSILSRRLVRSSGNKDWDEAVLRAIDRTATLPRDVDGRVPPLILLAFRPNELGS
ncbi:MAG: cell envelope integrity protein TolA [Burkholderiales bacterium]|nr:cell envelope integrity protein TolA [Burkholderiales bacterium]